MEIKVIKTNRKTISIQVNKLNLSVRILAPKNISHQDIKKIIKTNKKWIQQLLFKLNEERKLYENKFYYLGKEYSIVFIENLEKDIELKEKLYIKTGLKDVNLIINAFYKKLGEELIINKIEKISKIMGVKPKKIYLKNLKSRWGSCSNKGNICINIKIIKAPIEIINYIIIHELCHLIEMNHSNNFWDLVKSIDTNYLEHRKWLKNNSTKMLHDYNF